MLWMQRHFYQLKKVNTMKYLKLFTVTMVLVGMAGCITFGSGKSGPQGPQGPQGESGTKETIIVVPEK